MGVSGEVQLPLWFPIVVVKLVISMLQNNTLTMHGLNKHKFSKQIFYNSFILHHHQFVLHATIQLLRKFFLAVYI